MSPQGIEEALWGSKTFIEDNVFPSIHQNVNIYTDAARKYETRQDENAIDIQMKTEVFVKRNVQLNTSQDLGNAIIKRMIKAMQTNLFDDTNEAKPNKLGHTTIQYKQIGTILNKTSGFMEEYDFSLNPYSGCAFGCSYCYAAFFARDNAQKDAWGYWVNVKENALGLLKKFRSKPITEKTVYMSSVTDPYQPIERKIELTRDILKELLNYHQPRLVIQTRSPLVTRDIDLLQKFNVVQVNMTITTDSEKVRKVFEPLCPGNKARLDAIKEVSATGINSCITMTPLLPVENPETFAKDLLATGIQKFIIQPFHADRGKFTAGTREEAKKLFKEFGWTRARYAEVEAVIKSYIPDIGIGKEGFKPI